MSRGARDPRQPVTVKWDPTTLLLSFIGSDDDLPIGGFANDSQPAPTPASHGASLHTDRTRNRFIPLGGATIRTATPALAMQGTNTRYRGWAFDAAATEEIHIEFVSPEDVAGTTWTIKLWWTNLGAGTGDVKWQASIQKGTESGAEDQNSNGTVGLVTVTATAPTQNVLKVSSIAPSGSVAFGASALFNISLARLGADVADTLANDAGLIGIEIEYTADA